MAKKPDLKQEIIDTALSLADDKGWESVRLHQVARAMDIPLDTVRQYFREKEDIVDAWFDRADQAMLETRESASFKQTATREKLHILLINWLSALQPHRHATRQMIFGKLEPGHIHYQLKGLLRVSRTVQWLREAAGITSTLPLRAIEETALTGLYLTTFTKWMFDNSPNSKATSDFLKRKLNSACALLVCSDDTVPSREKGVQAGSNSVRQAH